MTAPPDNHLNRAKELLQVAEENLTNNHPADSISRSYYAVFHAATAVLKKLGIERSSHSSLWSAFGQYVAKENLIEPRLHRLALDTFSERMLSDYMADPKATIEDAQKYLTVARDFVSACENFLISAK